MKKLIFLVLPLSLLMACSSIRQNNYESCTLYYFDVPGGAKLVPVAENAIADKPENTVRSIYTKLTATDNKNLSPIITSDIKLVDVSVSEGLCTLTLSERYINIPESSRTAINACLVKTMCSLSYIDRVVISCKETQIEYEESDFITETPRTYYDTHAVNLYFANETADGLQADREIISLSPDTTLESVVISRLLKGPTSDKLKSAVPAGTQLNNIYVSEGMCIVDLSSEFVTNAVHDELSESITLYSVVNTITELPMINSVKFLIDGTEGYGYTYYDISKPLTNAASLFKK